MGEVERQPDPAGDDSRFSAFKNEWPLVRSTERRDREHPVARDELEEYRSSIVVGTAGPTQPAAGLSAAQSNFAAADAGGGGKLSRAGHISFVAHTEL